MIRKMIIVVVACWTLLCLAAAETNNGIVLKVCNNSFASTSPNSMRSATLIGKPVTNIWGYAFCNCSGFTSETIRYGVKMDCVAYDLCESQKPLVEGGGFRIPADELDMRTIFPIRPLPISRIRSSTGSGINDVEFH